MTKTVSVRRRRKKRRTSRNGSGAPALTASERAARRDAAETAALEYAAAGHTNGDAQSAVASTILREVIEAFRDAAAGETSSELPNFPTLSDWVRRAGDAVDTAEASHVGDERAADAELGAFAALTVFIARRWRDTEASSAAAAEDSSSSDDFTVSSNTLSKATCQALSRLVGGADVSAFRRRSGARRAATLHAALRVVEHASVAVRHGRARRGGEEDAAGESREIYGDTPAINDVTTHVLTLLAVLGQEFCLVREHARWRAANGLDDDEAPPPPPLTPELEAALAAAAATANEGSTTDQSTDGSDADILLERMEECHVLLLHALNALRRHVSGREAEESVLNPGTAALLSPTTAAFLHPRFPFRTKLRRRALRLVAAAATVARHAAAPGSSNGNCEAKAVSDAIRENAWPALKVLLEADHPARRSPANGVDPVLLRLDARGTGSGCARGVIETAARCMGTMLCLKSWSWGIAERELVTPFAPSDFWTKARAPHRALALRLYSRLRDASPVLGAGVGAPLLKLWTHATLDPAAGSGKRGKGGDDGDDDGDDDENSLGAEAKGLGRARARLTRAIRAHPKLANALPENTRAATPRGAPLARRAAWVREAFAGVSNACPKEASAAVVAASSGVWDIARSRAREVAGTPGAAAWADAVVGVCVGAARVAPESLHRLPSASMDGDGQTVSDDLFPTRLVATLRRVAERHCHASSAHSSAVNTHESAVATSAFAGPFRADAARVSLKRAEERLRRADEWLRDGFAALAKKSNPGGASPYVFDFADRGMVRALASLVHAAWERGPPREPSRAAATAAATAAWRAMTESIGGGEEREHSRAAQTRLRRFVLAAFVRRALTRVKHRSTTRPAFGSVASACGSLDAVGHLLTAADTRGECDEALRETLPMLGQSILDAVLPPPPPPDLTKSAPREHECVPPVVRVKLYELLTKIVRAAPSLAVTVAHETRMDSPVGEHLRSMLEKPDFHVSDATLSECARALLDACSRAAVAEVVASAGHRGATAARRALDADLAAKGTENSKAAIAHKRWYSAEDVASTAQTMRATLGQHPHLGGGFDDAMRGFTPPSQTSSDADDGKLASVFAGRNGSAAYGRIRTTPGAEAKDSAVGKDVDAAAAAIRFLAALARVSVTNAERIRSVAVPAFRGALGDDGANRSVRTLLASAATELWTACDEPMDTFPPPPGELNNYPAGTSSTGNQSRASPNLGMMNANGPGHSPLVTGEVYREKPRTRWPEDGGSPVGFGTLPESARIKPAPKVSIIGAVVSREPPRGTRRLQNPKTGRSYDMVFVTLGDHRGTRVKCQLIGKKAKAAADVLDREGADGSRTVIGLIGMTPQDRPGKGGVIATVWDPKEDSRLVLRPDHPVARKL